MGLEKVTIRVEGGEEIIAHFNPNKIVLSKTVNLPDQKAKGRDVPEQQFDNGQARSLNLDLLFDTYDNDKDQKEIVTVYTDKLDALTIVDKKKHRPPLCKLYWGQFGVFFEGVVEKLDHEFTLFMEDGTPVRATSKCSFKEHRTNQDDQKRQDAKSSDVAKQRTVKLGETLSSIAAEEYLDPAMWRPIADQNGLDDPFNLVPGTLLLVPTVTLRRRGRSRT